MLQPTFEDDNLLETLSIPTNNSGSFSPEENTPSTLPTQDTESSISSKKIRKKRNTYQKIDDDIRLKLLEAVQNGETLKAVAKRCNINYSSAKSILHTYRKEGRILKKSGQDRPFEAMFMSQNQQEQPQNFGLSNQQFSNLNLNLQTFPQTMTQKLDFSRIQSECPMNNNMNTHESSPTNGLMNNFMTKLQLGGFPEQNKPRPISNNVGPLGHQHPMFPMGSMYPNPMMNPTMMMNPMMNPNMNPMMMNTMNNQPMMNQMKPMSFNNYQAPMNSETVPMIPLGGLNNTFNNNNNNNNNNPFARAINMSPVNNPTSLTEQVLNNQNNNSPMAMAGSNQMKNFDSFYMNYSNSPLSGGGRMANDNTDSSAKNMPGEFESFSDMVSAMQGIPNNNEEKFMPQLAKGIPSFGSLDKIDFPQEINRSGVFDSATQNTFKALMDTQYKVGDAIRKASYYKDLSPFQKMNPEGSGLPNVKLLNLMG